MNCQIKNYRDTTQTKKRKNQNSKSKRKDNFIKKRRHKWQDSM